MQSSQSPSFVNHYVSPNRESTYALSTTKECTDSVNYSADKVGLCIAANAYNPSPSTTYQQQQNIHMPTIAVNQNNVVATQQFPAQAVSFNYTIQNIEPQHHPIQNTVNQNVFQQPESNVEGVRLSLATGSSTEVIERETRQQRLEKYKVEKPHMYPAIEAVRQGMPFCQAARTFRINNRTLWLEYQKLGFSSGRNRVKFYRRLE